MARPGKSLDTVKKLAAAAERREAARLAEYMRRFEDKSAKLGALRQYLDEYAARFERQAGGGIAVASLRSQRAFLAQLNEAIGQQGTAAAAAEHALAEQRARWLAAKRRLDALEELIARRHDTERKRADQREQRALDDLAAQQWTRGR